MTFQEIENTVENKDSVIDNAPGYKLYSAKAVMVATFFGTALAGGYLIAKNYQRLGNQSGARQALLYSLLVIIATCIAGYFLPESFPSLAVSLPILIAMGQVTKQLQGKAFEQHLKNHGQYESCWKVLGISLLFMAAIAVISIAGLILLFPGDFYAA